MAEQKEQWVVDPGKILVAVMAATIIGMGTAMANLFPRVTTLESFAEEQHRYNERTEVWLRDIYMSQIGTPPPDPGSREDERGQR